MEDFICSQLEECRIEFREEMRELQQHTKSQFGVIKSQFDEVTGKLDEIIKLMPNWLRNNGIESPDLIVISSDQVISNPVDDLLNNEAFDPVESGEKVVASQQSWIEHDVDRAKNDVAIYEEICALNFVDVAACNERSATDVQKVENFTSATRIAGISASSTYSIGFEEAIDGRKNGTEGDACSQVCIAFDKLTKASQTALSNEHYAHYVLDEYPQPFFVEHSDRNGGSVDKRGVVLPIMDLRSVLNLTDETTMNGESTEIMDSVWGKTVMNYHAHKMKVDNRSFDYMLDDSMWLNELLMIIFDPGGSHPHRGCGLLGEHGDFHFTTNVVDAPEYIYYAFDEDSTSHSSVGVYTVGLTLGIPSTGFVRAAFHEFWEQTQAFIMLMNAQRVLLHDMDKCDVVVTAYVQGNVYGNNSLPFFSHDLDFSWVVNRSNLDSELIIKLSKFSTQGVSKKFYTSESEIRIEFGKWRSQLVVEDGYCLFNPGGATRRNKYELVILARTEELSVSINVMINKIAGLSNHNIRFLMLVSLGHNISILFLDGVLWVRMIDFPSMSKLEFNLQVCDPFDHGDVIGLKACTGCVCVCIADWGVAKACKPQMQTLIEHVSWVEEALNKNDVGLPSDIKVLLEMLIDGTKIVRMVTWHRKLHGHKLIILAGSIVLDNFVWDPGQDVISLYIIEDNDVLKRKGIRIQLALALKQDDISNEACAHYYAHTGLLACSLVDWRILLLLNTSSKFRIRKPNKLKEILVTCRSVGHDCEVIIDAMRFKRFDADSELNIVVQNMLQVFIVWSTDSCSKHVKSYKVSLSNKGVIFSFLFNMFCCSLKSTCDRQYLGFWFGDKAPNGCPASVLVIPLSHLSCSYHSLWQCHRKREKCRYIMDRLIVINTWSPAREVNEEIVDNDTYISWIQHFLKHRSTGRQPYKIVRFGASICYTCCTFGNGMGIAAKLLFLATGDDTFVGESEFCHFTTLRTRRFSRGMICHESGLNLLKIIIYILSVRALEDVTSSNDTFVSLRYLLSVN